MMRTAWALASTEIIKLSRTMALRLALAIPVVVFAIELIALFHREHQFLPDAAAMWRDLLRGGWAMWVAILMPMLIAFEAAFLANLEHGDKLWKQLFSFPIPRWSAYVTKILFCGLLAGASFLVVALGFVGDVLFYSAHEHLGLAASIPWAELLSFMGKAYLATWLIIAVQSWLSARFPGFATSVGLGFAGMVLGPVILSIFGRSGEQYASWYPWMMALRTLSSGPRDLHSTVLPAVLGCVGGILVGAMACWDLGRREVV